MGEGAWLRPLGSECVDGARSDLEGLQGFCRMSLGLLWAGQEALTSMTLTTTASPTGEG